jgi:hypothetical protein
VSEESFYYRKKSSSQTSEVARMQIASNEMWGGPKRNYVSSDEPVVNAYVGEIPRKTEKGIEFTTAIKRNFSITAGRDGGCQKTKNLV